jgi:hypothetical protein
MTKDGWRWKVAQGLVIVSATSALAFVVALVGVGVQACGEGQGITVAPTGPEQACTACCDDADGYRVRVTCGAVICSDHDHYQRIRLDEGGEEVTCRWCDGGRTVTLEFWRDTDGCFMRGPERFSPGCE